MLTAVDIENLRNTIAEQMHPDKIFLFGSYADGRATDDSDIDFLVVMRSELQPHRRQSMASQGGKRPAKY
jgi:uncharacterized protein